MTNFSQIDEKLSEWIDAHTDEIIRETQGILRIPSVKGPEAPGAPFGAETRQALDYALDLTARYGLTTKNLDGYAAHAEWIAPSVSETAPIVGVLAHVDVVPEGDASKWKHEPFGAEIDNGILYGRGAIDDKGPAMAGLYAILAVAACDVPAKRRVRLILGADEESGFGCVKHYFTHEEMPESGFTPDAEFPLVYAEKGISDAVLTKQITPNSAHLHIVELNGGQRPNMVPDKATAVLSQQSGSWTAISARLGAAVGVRTEEFDNGTKLRVTAEGVSAHGSTPEEGVNADVVLCDALMLLDLDTEQHAFVKKIYEWGGDTTGGKLGIAGSDEIAGSLTSNLGIVSYAEGQLSLTFNIRYPVTWNQQMLRDGLEPVAAEAGFEIARLSNTSPLYVPQDDPLVAALLEVYRAETNDLQNPLTIGGGTYARVMRKGVAFGPSFPGSIGGAPHQADESWAVADLIRATKIYAKAIARLACQH